MSDLKQYYLNTGKDSSQDYETSLIEEHFNLSI